MTEVFVQDKNTKVGELLYFYLKVLKYFATNN